MNRPGEKDHKKTFHTRTKPVSLFKCALLWYLVSFGIALILPGLIKAFRCNLSTYYSLLIAFFTLIATIGVAWIIYLTQKQDSMNEQRRTAHQAKRQLSIELENALDMMIFPVDSEAMHFAGGTIKETYSKYIGDLQDDLSMAQLRHLSAVVGFIHYFSENTLNGEGGDLLLDDGYRLVLRDWMVPIMCSKYRKYYTSVFDFHDVLNQKTFDLLECLDEGDGQYNRNLYQIRNLNDDPLFEYDPVGGTYRIFDGDILIADGKIGDQWAEADVVGICDGYDKDSNYEGYYKDGYYGGQGCKFDSKGHKYAEGIWENGDLEQGIEYDCIIYEPDDEESEFICQYGDFDSFLDVSDLMRYIDIEHIEQYSVTNFNVRDDKVKYSDGITLTEFLKERNPKLLQRIMEEQDYTV